MIKELSAQYRIGEICEALEVSPSSYYAALLEAKESIQKREAQ